jgi:glycosyltransferase involved in cell wall biosynthesis
VILERNWILTILPTYNRAQLLPGAIESVLEQDYHFKKLMVVIDGSVDETEHICRGYAKEYPETISYEVKGNGGCASARNWGLNFITEEIGYVCFLDDDDRFLPGKFKREVKLLKDNPGASFSYTDSIIYNEETCLETVRKVAGAGRPEHFALEHFLTNEAKSAAILYRADVVKHNRFREDLQYNEDSEFLQRIAIEYKGVYSKEPSCWVRNHGGSKSRNVIEIRKAVLHASVDIVRSYPEFYRAHKNVCDRQIKKYRTGLFVELGLRTRWEEARSYSSGFLQNALCSLHLKALLRVRRYIGRLIIQKRIQAQGIQEG